ncbi:MAG TPA: hypothetical protein VMS14_08070, partial [Ilumatobacteraceae bacterium]|nr:hypothetical protein [Ilumatobacteraceae bacterium]
AYGLGGMTAGYVQGLTPDPQWWLAMIFATIGAAVGELAVPLIESVTGESGWVSRDLVLDVTVVAVAAGVLCPVLMPVGRWMMGVKRKKWKVIPE